MVQHQMFLGWNPTSTIPDFVQDLKLSKVMGVVAS